MQGNVDVFQTAFGPPCAKPTLASRPFVGALIALWMGAEKAKNEENDIIIIMKHYYETFNPTIDQI